MGGDPGQFGYFLIFIVIFALFSFLDAQARRNRQEQRKQPAEGDDPRATPQHRPNSVHGELEEETISLEDESEWAYLARVPLEDEIAQGDETWGEDPPAREAPVVTPVAAQERVPRDAPAREEVPAAAEALPRLRVTTSRPARAAVLTALRGDADALRKAVLYREILGKPLGSRPGLGGWEEPPGERRD